MRLIVLHRANPATGQYGKCAMGSQQMMTSHIAVTTFGLHNVASCGECLPNALETVASETLAITRGRVIPQCEENHLIGDWPYAARCIREPGHQIDWSHNPGTGPVILSKDQHFDRYGNVWV